MPKILRSTVPALAVGGALVLAAVSPASADGGWWYSADRPTGAKVYFTESGDKVTVCDIDTDGYKAMVDVSAETGYWMYRLEDSYNNRRCTSKSAANGGPYDLTEGDYYLFTVCIIKTGDTRKFCSRPIRERNL
ncbi:hypothetical protein [Streptomyces chattanoogensis]|uniref:hypothetical protein n=1 Tax=Streptomyces chattanoogensis TaxID=66876 RepID=UPI0036AB05BD